jgi:dipeptidase D
MQKCSDAVGKEGFCLWYIIRFIYPAFFTPLQTEVVHAGLECGFIAEKYPHMEIISIGPNLEYVHTPRERLHVPSVERIALFLRELLQDLGK